jgi:hypothetical protein
MGCHALNWHVPSRFVPAHRRAMSWAQKRLLLNMPARLMQFPTRTGSHDFDESAESAGVA